MADDGAAFVGSIPELYDRYLGPLLFHGFADDLVSRLPITDPMRVLETACGTGIVTAQLVERMPTHGSVLATDLNESMIAQARTRFGADARVDWQVADATRLPLPSGSFDAVLCQFGLMFFPDKSAGVNEALRVLRPGGIYLFNVWDSIERNPATRIAHETAVSFFPADPPRFYTLPFVLHDPDRVLALLTAAGFRDVVWSSVDSRGESPSATEAARGLIEGNPIVGEIVERDPTLLPQITAAVAANLAAELGDQPLQTPLRAHVFAARRAE